MKFRSIQFKALMTTISAMLAIAVFIGGLSMYEVDNFVQSQTEDYINAVCEKNASQINDVFGDMEKAVRIIESYVYGIVGSETDIKDPQRQEKIIKLSEEMFMNVAKNTDDAVAYYLRFAPEISNNVCGFFFSKEEGKGDFVSFEPTDISLYDKSDTEHVGWYWQAYDAGKPIWMLPYYNKNNKIYMISFVIPLFYENEFFGVVGMDFDYTILTDRIHKMKVYENGFAHLEYEGKVMHSDIQPKDEKFCSRSPEYLRISKELVNGMKLVLSASYKDIKKIRYDIGFKILYVVLILGLLFCAIAIFIVKRIVHPLKALTDASVKLANGNYDVKIKHSNTYEIKLLSKAFENMIEHLKEHEKLQHLLAYRDSLTGLRNTNSYKTWVTDFDKEMQNGNVDFGVMVLDINYLKETNDKYGHDTGNKLIVAAAQIISGVFKRSPVFRIGGDEFLVILRNRDLEDINDLSVKLEEECKNESVILDGKTIPVSIAKGFVRFEPSRDSGFIDVFNRADDAMYDNKRQIKGLK